METASESGSYLSLSNTQGMREMREMKKVFSQCPMPHAQCPMPNAQCPMPKSN
ncbi:MAG: hypothetical protein V7L05_12570 [Nostoc sp.]|uniref:hypothetical protein n=1 Tax=Nostoc sp. TaxID=1180 RepID=UPI002FFA62A5